MRAHPNTLKTLTDELAAVKLAIARAKLEKQKTLSEPLSALLSESGAIPDERWSPEKGSPYQKDAPPLCRLSPDDQLMMEKRILNSIGDVEGNAAHRKTQWYLSMTEFAP